VSAFILDASYALGGDGRLDKLIHRAERTGADGLPDGSFLIGLQGDRHVWASKWSVPHRAADRRRVNPIP